ncbi:VOC family protein [Streptomyces sp. ISL-66]|uniref:VOC family protein n=1 Tax=Streptomyces sp. ISL-66 TaxID=2819186 RepID=UPI0027E4B7D0|nr:VOC family protein [Streptomyces sp. ISL-66]
MTVHKTSVLVLDCAEPEPLARFYAAPLGANAGPGPGGGEMYLLTGSSGVVLGVRRDPDHAPRSWPTPESSQQVHLRILAAADSLDEAEREARPWPSGPDRCRPRMTAAAWTTVRRRDASPTRRDTPLSSRPSGSIPPRTPPPGDPLLCLSPGMGRPRVTSGTGVRPLPAVPSGPGRPLGSAPVIPVFQCSGFRRRPR